MAEAVTVKRMTKLEGKGTVKALCDLAIGEQFLVKGLRVVDGKNGLFVSMPRQKTKEGEWFDSVQTLTKDAKKIVERVVLDAYQQGAEVAATD